MSKKAASWIAAGLTLFVTLLLGAVLVRPVLTLSQGDNSAASGDTPSTIVQDNDPKYSEYDDDDYYEGEDDDRYEHDDDEDDDDDRYEHEDDDDHDDD